LAPRQIGAFTLALLLFLGSLLAGRVISANPVPISPATSPHPTSTQAVPDATATATPNRTPAPTPTHPPSPTPTLQSTGTVFLDETNTTVYALPQDCLIHPLRLLVWGDDVYALDTGQLKLIGLGAEPTCRSIRPPGGLVDGTVLQEVADVSLSESEGSLLLLDRAGNVFRYSPIDDDWQVERLAHAAYANSRQYLVTVCAHQDAFYLLDANVGQIWQHTHQRAEIIPADLDLRESVDLAVGEDVFVLAQEGYRGPLRLHRLVGQPLERDPAFVPPPDLENPSLLFLDQEAGGYLYVVDMSHQRLRVLDPSTGDLVREYLFASEGPQIDAAYARGQKLYLASRDAIHVYPREPAGPGGLARAPAPQGDLMSLPPHDSRVLGLLPPLTPPIEGTMISDLAFRLPGAPRSYRYGVHEGIDFYWAAGEMVTDTTPVLSVADGKVVRADTDYEPPTLQAIEAMLAHAEEVYHTPEDVLDVLRGRQVWIEHESGLVSRYCHLSAVAEDLEAGDRVEQGQMIGYVGNSGTPASYYDPGQEMHLHLEIRIGEGYLGRYLRPIEVKRWLYQIFGADA